MDKLRSITVPAGIGDFVWLAQKLVNCNERFHIKLPDGKPQRGHQILKLLPQIVASHEYTPGLNYAKIKQANITNSYPLWRSITKTSFVLSANTHLEGGERIEQFLPDLKTSFALDYNTTKEDKKTASLLLIYIKHYIGIYTSAYNNARHWGGWGVDEWFKLIRLLYSRNKDFVFVVIGAEYDISLSDLLMDKLNENKIPFVNTIGQPLSVVIEIMKLLDYAFYFPSGLGILSATLSRPSVMFYPKHLEKMQGTYCEPALRDNGTFKECQFCEVEKLYDWLDKEYQLFKKL